MLWEGEWVRGEGGGVGKEMTLATISSVISLDRNKSITGATSPTPPPYPAVIVKEFRSPVPTTLL